ncbi:unnamed protein product [Phytophthora fragariaefolia]|uniref:Unnamed protein product n=1 Tax=Phytophthora fragariaefolia TaxID=1490495 RepID=A0A9W6U6F7_9STRA|nr:unnamed protein product [Phytophthora fragariaefolia]
MRTEFEMLSSALPPKTDIYKERIFQRVVATAQSCQGGEGSVGPRRRNFWIRCSRRAPSVQERRPGDGSGWTGVSMSADSKLGPDDEDNSVPDASTQASVGGADVVGPPVGGSVSRSPQPQHEVEASDDDDGEVELMKV